MNENEIERIAAAVACLRPDWPMASLRTLLARPQVANRPRRDVAVALVWVACDSETKTPARFLESGPWWRAAVTEDQRVPRNPAPHEECGKHAGQFRLSCSGCRADKLAADNAARPEPLTREQALEQARADIAAARAARAATEPEIEIKETIA